MTIQIIHDGQWTKVENKDKHNCDRCKAELWIAPDGKTLYCDRSHEVRHTI